MKRSNSNMDRRVLLAGLGGAVAGSLLTGKAQAGPLNPPAGGVFSTGVSVQQLADKIAKTPQGFGESCIPIQSLSGSTTSMFEVLAPGSYYLTDNIHAVSGMDVLSIKSPDVDLDMCGYSIISPGGTPGGGTAIRCDQENCCVYDGSIVGGDRGLDFSLASRFIIWDVTCRNCTSFAVLFGSRGLGYDCEAHGIGGVGYAILGERNEVEECSAVTCNVGFRCSGTQNLIISNSATECALPFDIVQGNSHGKIVSVVGVGDMSAVAGANFPTTNFIF